MDRNSLQSVIIRDLLTAKLPFKEVTTSILWTLLNYIYYIILIQNYFLKCYFWIGVLLNSVSLLTFNYETGVVSGLITTPRLLLEKFFI